MIQQTTRRIHFTPYIGGRRKKEINEESQATCTVNRRLGYITFNSSLCSEIGMDNKFVRMFSEPTKKIIGWRVIDEKVNQTKMSGLKLIKLHPKTRNAKISILPMFKDFMGLKSDSYKRLPVKKYVENQDILDRGATYYFVTLKEPTEQDDE